MNDNYGVIAGIGEGIKIGLFFLQDIACLAAVIVPGVVISQTAFPPTQTKLSFTFLAIDVAFAFYMDLHPLSNPGKRNFQVIWMLIREHRRSKSYKSLGYYEFHSIATLKKEWSHGNTK